jgi:hypothetical protein
MESLQLSQGCYPDTAVGTGARKVFFKVKKLYLLAFY